MEKEERVTGRVAGKTWRRYFQTAGVALMTFGCMQEYNISVPVVPIGLTYFSRSTFRSRVIIEFGPPVKLTEELGRAQFLSQGWQKGSTTCRCLPQLAIIIGGRNFKTTFLAPVILVWALRP